MLRAIRDVVQSDELVAARVKLLDQQRFLARAQTSRGEQGVGPIGEQPVLDVSAVQLRVGDVWRRLHPTVHRLSVGRFGGDPKHVPATLQAPCGFSAVVEPSKTLLPPVDLALSSRTPNVSAVIS